LERCRPRAIAVSSIGIVGLLAFLQFVPLPSHFRAPGVLLAQDWTVVAARAAGKVKQIHATPGPVKAGQPLLELENHELEIMLANAQAEHEEIQSRWRASLSLDAASLAPLQARLESSRKLLERLEEDKRNLMVRARLDGIWVVPHLEEMTGRWLPRGSSIGLLINPARFEFSATVLQEEADRLLIHSHASAEVRLFGQAENKLVVNQLRVIPGEQYTLPTIALGWAGGGEIPVSGQDRQGRLAAEPFFNVIGKVTAPEGLALLHGRTGKIRFDIGNEPLLPRAVRKLQQMLQKRYQI
jgi:putative peptide zinc metalloprotease protein